MKKSELKQIIKEELQNVLTENIKNDVQNFVSKLNKEFKKDNQEYMVKFGGKFAKIFHKSTKWDKEFGAVWGFVALKDDPTKNIKLGDLLRAASYNAPAKHARGNILNNSGRYDWTGPDYLK